MRGLNKISFGAIILFLVISVSYYPEYIAIILFSMLLISVIFSVSELKSKSKRRRGYFKG